MSALRPLLRRPQASRNGTAAIENGHEPLQPNSYADRLRIEQILDGGAKMCSAMLRTIFSVDLETVARAAETIDKELRLFARPGNEAGIAPDLGDFEYSASALDVRALERQFGPVLRNESPATGSSRSAMLRRSGSRSSNS